ncbi:RNA-binding protein [Desulfuromonas versatilis]|uniref:RNA-binding protein n=1 Tax=Desulfuromonas versatilis TaxID=2802975 RepID=A0ABM8HNE2_9BACT|nr:RNA-binding protein [Desulfuromonas versatilis]BCR02991.1 RNA-binding protein [Desulfuromonas versatilis]
MGKDLYVTNISFQATEEDLRKLFAVAGTVRSVNLLTDPKTGLLKGNGFVRMASEAEAKEAAVILDGALLINREIGVSLARDKAERAGQRPPEERPAKGKGHRGGRR